MPYEAYILERCPMLDNVSVSVNYRVASESELFAFFVRRGRQNRSNHIQRWKLTTWHRITHGGEIGAKDIESLLE